MFEYKFKRENGNVIINFSPKLDVANAKNEIIEQRPDFTYNRTTYPDGLIVESKVSINEIIMLTNRKLIKNPDGTFTFEK